MAVPGKTSAERDGPADIGFWPQTKAQDRLREVCSKSIAQLLGTALSGVDYSRFARWAAHQFDSVLEGSGRTFGYNRRFDRATNVLGIRAYREVCEHYGYRSPAIATALTPQLGYKGTAEIVQKAMASGRTIPDVRLEEHVLGRKALGRLLDPRRMTEPGLPRHPDRVRSHKKRGS